jgi:HlyD family secretion protein
VAQAAEAEVAVAQEALALLQAEQSDPDYLLRVYDARIASTEAELAQLQDQAQRTQMRSPVNGQVLKVMQRSAQFVSAGTPLLEIGDPSQLELVIDVLSSDAEKIQIGDAIRIASGQGDSLQGRVKRIEPSAFTKVSALGVEEQRVNVIGEFVSPPRYLGDGYRVETGIVIWQNPQVLQVPLSSLFRCHTSSWCTFVVEHGKAVQRQVQIDHRSQFAVEVQQGLKAGETVILHPTEQIHEGSRVTARNSAS